MNGVKSYIYGFPRIGKDREFKKFVEAYWTNKVSENEVLSVLDKIQSDMIDKYNNMDFYPVGEITAYDNILDTAIIFGIYPKFSSLKDYYKLVRGEDSLEITKWFNTNYHYVVPHIDENTKFSLSWNKPFEYYKKYKSDKAIPFVVGPLTFVKLSKGKKDYKKISKDIIKVYSELLSTLKEAKFVHIDDPALVYELTSEEKEFVKEVYSEISKAANIIVITYYDDVLEDVLEILLKTNIMGIGLDFVRGKRNYEAIKNLKEFFKNKILIAGVVDGKNVWKDNVVEVSERVKKIVYESNAKEVWISNAAPLFHLPYTVEVEENLDLSIKERLAFATEKIKEINFIRAYLSGDESAKKWNDYMYDNSWWFSKEIQERVKNLKEEDFKRKLPYSERIKLHKQILNLPKFPITTIGSFPQTEDVRQMRLKYKKGEISKEEYQKFIREKIKEVIKIQEELDLDVFVHGEFERSDMVEYFAEKLKGMATTEHGWVLSYGTRAYRAPIIFGDVYREGALTVDEIVYAQSLTNKPVKGMLTGPITILAWSYTRTDIPEKEQAFQIALAILDEVKDLEKNGIKVIQIDEPAFREKAPIKRRDWSEYFDWAIKAFKIASNASPEIQLHTHMCYSEFGEIVDKIYDLDADVISIETSRSGGDIIEAFEKFNYDHQIGLGVYDVHSPEVPSTEKMRKVVERSLRVINSDNFWINPDCGLKTRKWEETIPSLKNMVQLAKKLRG